MFTKVIIYQTEIFRCIGFEFFFTMTDGIGADIGTKICRIFCKLKLVAITAAEFDDIFDRLFPDKVVDNLRLKTR